MGGFISIFCIYFISYYYTGLIGTNAILPSMGAATVLLFYSPQGLFSRPWSLFAGNLLSALVGVCCYQWFGDTFIGASSAVAISMLVMSLGHCIHPPGGATALAAVVGGDLIHQLGFSYVIITTLLNCLIIYMVSALFNRFVQIRE